MNLKQIAANMLEMKVNDGLTILISYQTCVACIWTNGNQFAAYQTDKKWSATTKRHINKWLLEIHPEVWGAAYKPQEYFDALLSEVK